MNERDASIDAQSLLRLDAPPVQDLAKSPLTPDRPYAEATRTTPTTAPAPVRRLEYIDGLRAAAALWVLCHHTIETSEPVAAMHLPVVGSILTSLFFGQFPVMVFLMLSGFCLYFPCVKKNVADPTLKTSYGTFLLRRFKRIAPPYYAAGALCLVMFLFPALQTGRWAAVGPIDGKVVLSHLFFFHNLIPSHATKIDYPMWSIGLEWQLYLLFPLLVWCFRRSNGPVVIGVTLAIAAVIRGTYRILPPDIAAVLHDGPFSYLEIFAAGMFAARLTVQERKLLPNWALGCIVIAGFAIVRLGTGNGLVHDLATSAAAFGILLLAIDPNSAMSRCLSAPWLVRIGIFSYSLYLVHAPLLHLLWFALRPLQLSADATYLILVLCAPVLVALAYGFHRLFERPFMRVT